MTPPPLPPAPAAAAALSDCPLKGDSTAPAGLPRVPPWLPDLLLAAFPPWLLVLLLLLWLLLLPAAAPAPAIAPAMAAAPLTWLLPSVRGTLGGEPV